MKKLNKKGFTLVELLAVIIILAIVVGITIPAVLTTVSKTKLNAFNTAATTTADWIDRQYQVATTGLGASGMATLDPSFSSICGTTGATCAASKAKKITDAKFIVAAGLKSTNISTIQVKIDPKTGRSCVTLTAKKNGEYYGVADGNQVSAGAC